ncbi:MAG: sigma-70 family RNA polymerase sigma factor [Phycisphaeraceae bacterium]
MDQQTFRALALGEMDAVYRMAFHLAGHPDGAAELVQETYLRALRAEATFELRDRGIRPWLFKILHNTFYTQVARSKREPALAEDLSAEPAAGHPDDPPPVWDLAGLDWEYVDERLKHAIDDLPPHYREVLLLWAVEGLKYREIAEVMGLPLGTVMSRLYRAREHLSGQLADLAAEQGIAVPDCQ